MSDGALPPVIRAMLRPEFYPHPVAAGRLRLVQTHASYVLLTGDFAYKVKKPVDLGFLDFTTLARRRHFCEEEVRLNRRGAPGMYLGVVSITSGPARSLVFGGDGPAVEYAVKMRQFPEAALLSGALARGELSESDAVALAATVAAYHAESRVIDSGAFGSPAMIWRGMDDSFRSTANLVGDLIEPRWFEETQRFADDVFARHSPLLWSRIDGGYVRGCHGDLHLGNVCRWNGKTLLFDCIEFDDEFSHVDVYCDVAFAMMDFDAHGFPALANAFMNAYAELTGDWEGLRVLPLYLCRNAYVRAKVNALRLETCVPNSDEAAAARRDAMRYFELAWQYARRPRHGRLVLMCGASGSGKTTLARHLAKRWGAVHLRSDAVRKHLAGVPLDRRAGADAYCPEMTRRTYARMLELGLALAADGGTVLLDARYVRVTLRTSALDAAVARGVPLRIVHCVAPPEVLHERVVQRAAAAAGDVSDATDDLLFEQLQEFEPFQPAEAPYVLSVDTRRPVDHLAGEVNLWCATDVRLTRRLQVAAPA